MLVGQHIGPFAVEKELGAGAMGAVFLARHDDTGQRVAIKVVAAGLASNATIMARFKREASILKQLKHPNIVRLVATGKFQGTPFYAMEYIDGESLDHVIARRGRLTWEEVVEFGQQLCAALQHAHENGILHRDLKPSNVMVLANGTVKLTDFGIAKDLDRTQLTADHRTVGTASYMSPEQCKGERDLTSRSDLYSMGVMFYELLTGRKPFIADDPVAMFMKHVNDPFERPSRRVLDIPVWLDNLVCQLLEKQPDQRPVSAAMVGRALSQVKEKVLAQQSAGVDAARTRNVDRPRGQPKLEDEDKDAARTLLGRKKRKKKAVPIFQRRWFQGVLLSVLLVGIVIVLARALQPPSPEELYAQASGIMEDSDPERWGNAKESIDKFLEYYPDHEKAKQVRNWANKIEAQGQEDLLRRRMHLRHTLGREFEPESEAEVLAYQAVRYQDFGDLATARERWQELKKKTEKDTSEKAWRLVAERKLEELKGKAPEPRNPKEVKAEAAARVALVQKKVNEAIKLVDAGKTTEAHSLADDIVNLYGKNDTMAKQVDEAKKVRAELAKAKGSS